ncbi:MAG: PorT family protein [Bacteroidales bacterium]|nr:PorT family protein [Bacteroidales bacterium]
MKHNIILSMFVAAGLLLSSGEAVAQWRLSAIAGADINSHLVNSQFAYDYHYVPEWGYTFGVEVEYAFSDWFSLKAGLDAISKNFKMTRSGFYKNIYEAQKNTYLQLPVMASFSFGGQRLRGFLNVGPYAGVQLSRFKKGITPGVVAGYSGVMQYSDYNIRNDFSAKADNRFDAGIVAGVGIGFQVSELIGLALEVRDSQSLVSTKKTSRVVSTLDLNNTCAFLVSISFSL